MNIQKTKNCEYHLTAIERLLIKKNIVHRRSHNFSWRFCFVVVLSTLVCSGFAEDSTDQTISIGFTDQVISMPTSDQAISLAPSDQDFPVEISAWNYRATPFIGASIVSLGTTAIYAKPPSKLWGNLWNERIDRAERGQAFRVISQKSFPTFSGGNAIWLQVERPDNSSDNSSFSCQPSNTSCWTYLGIQPDTGEKTVTWNYSVE